MTNNEIQYTIYIRSTKESIPVSKEEFDAYYHDINIYRIRQQRHGRCVCPASKRLTCDMDCLTLPMKVSAAQKKWERLDSYGPKFVENIVQATARDILSLTS